MIRFVILASGNGSNAQALMEKAASLSAKCQCVAVISDKENPGVKLRAQSNKINFYFVDPREGKQKQEEKIFKLIASLQADWIFLAGYMRILSSTILEKLNSYYQGDNRVLNIHPSLLPKYRGKDAYQQAFDSTDRESGISIHFVDSGIDTGPILIQEKFPKLSKDSFETFQARGLELEHKMYAKVLEKIVLGENIQKASSDIENSAGDFNEEL